MSSSFLPNPSSIFFANVEMSSKYPLDKIIKFLISRSVASLLCAETLMDWRDDMFWSICRPTSYRAVNLPFNSSAVSWDMVSNPRLDADCCSDEESLNKLN